MLLSYLQTQQRNFAESTHPNYFLLDTTELPTLSKHAVIHLNIDFDPGDIFQFSEWGEFSQKMPRFLKWGESHPVLESW